MTESVIFSFTKIDDFFEVLIDANIYTTDFDGVTNNFSIILAEACPDNIMECVDTDWILDETVMTLIGASGTDGDCALAWEKGVNANRQISIANSSIVYNISNSTHALKGAFLVHKATGVCLAYSINTVPILVKNQIITPVDGMVWRIYSQLYEG